MNFFKKFEKLKVKYKTNKKRILSITVTAVGIACLLIGSSMAYLLFEASGTTQTISAGTLQLSYTNESEAIILNNAVPQSDEQGLNNNVYSITLTNTSTIKSYYELSLNNNCTVGNSYTVNGSSVTANVCIPNNYLKVAVKTNKDEDYTIKNGGNVILKGYLEAKENISFEMIIWLTEETPNDYQGQTETGTPRNVIYNGNFKIYTRQLLGNEYTITNMIKNGNFEKDAANWALSGASITSDEKYSGEKSLMLSPNTTAMSTQTLSSTAPVLNHKYYGSIMYKTASGLTAADNRFEWYNTDNDLLTKDVSKAVDNEARRLKVMSYAVDVDASKGKNLEILDEPLHTDDDKLKEVLNNTWMAAETAKIDISVDTDKKEEVNDNTTVDVQHKEKPDFANTQFTNVNFGLMERPKTKLVLEKHITGLTIKPVESGVRLIADARADIENILNNVTEGQITLEGEQTGLLAIKSTRSNRGYWYLQTDTTELAQGADAYITYTYVITNKGDEDYLSEDLVTAYWNNSKTIGETTYTYENYLKYLENTVKKQIKLGSFTKGTYLSNFYYTGNTDGAKEVLASVESMQEFLNPKVSFVSGDNMMNNTTGESKPYYTTNGTLENQNITEKVTSNSSTGKLVRKGDDDYNVTETETKNKNTDWSKKIVVSKALSASEIESGGVYDSYIAEITHYTNAAGRRDQSTPANLSYVHSEDTRITLDSENPDTNKKYNEEDEFWAETFRITKPTGEDKLTPVQIAVITISAVAVLGIGIILIKKFVLKK